MTRSKPRSAIPLAAATTAVVAALTGCSFSGTTYTGAPAVPTDHPAADEQPALNGVRAFDLGQIVVDGEGYVLYRYDKDTARPPKSACDDTCTQQWKPVTGEAAQHLRGIDPALAGTLTRADGTDQATLAGWPLYRFGKDEMPGETAGLGVGGVWFPVTPQGGKVTAAANPGQSSAFGL